MKLEDRDSFSVPQAADVLGVCPNTVRALIRDGHLGVIPHVPRRHLIPRRELERFINAGVTPDPTS